MKRLPAFLACILFCAVSLTGLEKTISFSADSMSGTSGKKDSITVLEGNASVLVETLKITGDRIELSGKDFRFVLAEGNITGSDSEKGFSFTADRLMYDRETEIASFQGNAVLRDTENEVETSAGIISYNQKTEVAFLQIDVRLKRKNIESVSGFALYRRTLSRLELSGSPKVTRSGDVFSADRIAVDLETEYISLDGSVSGTLESTAEAPPDGETGETDETGEAAETDETSTDVSADPDPGATDTTGEEPVVDDDGSGSDTPETGEGTDDE